MIIFHMATNFLIRPNDDYVSNRFITENVNERLQKRWFRGAFVQDAFSLIIGFHRITVENQL